MEPETFSPTTFSSVTLIAHADWSKHPAKRWVALARREPDYRWHVSQILNIDYPHNLFLLLKSQLLQPGCILAGFDFPIGFPAAYASKAGITDFLSYLPRFGLTKWADFYLPADDLQSISLQRPFYPAKPGSSKRAHLEQRLGLPFSQLYRRCEKAHQNRRAACPLFWTMGGQQVGKAAIAGWQYLLAPAILNSELNLKIWPFSGVLADLCCPGNIVVVETYPGEYYNQLGLSFSAPIRRSKRRQGDRTAFAGQLLDWASQHDLALADPIRAQIQNGFGSSPTGEDQFDALVGLYGMISVILGKHPFGEPQSALISNIEGWIFGQDQPPEGNEIGNSIQ